MQRAVILLDKFAFAGLLAFLAASGCANQNQMLDSDQPMAIQTAVSRGRFDLNCSSATGQIISREVVQPALQSPWVNGIQRVEFTVGVSGCGRRKSYIVVCPQGGNGCFAAGPGPFQPNFE